MILKPFPQCHKLFIIARPNCLFSLLQCPNGHTLCSKCKHRVNNRCPSCHREINNIRCLALEKIAQSLDFPCSYQSQGCHEIFPYYDRLRHEHQCKFRPYNCPYAGSDCTVTGDISTLMAHLTNDHKVDLHVGCTFNHRYVKSNPLEVQNATWMLTVSYMQGILALIAFVLTQSVFLFGS